MLRNKTSLIIYSLIGLAIFGFIATLLDDAIGLLISLFVSLVIGGAVIGLIYFFFIKNRETDELKKYRKALKQSKQRNKSKGKSVVTQPINHTNIRKKNSKKSASHLRVIDGNKEKKKNRASL